MMNKKTIGLVTNWYPTDDNPYAGMFFREQAIEMGKQFDYCVIHCIEKKNQLLIAYFAKKILGKKYSLTEIKKEYNITEYNMVIFFPFIFVVFNALYKMFYKVFKARYTVGIGEHHSSKYISVKKKNVGEAFKKFFDKKLDVLYCVDAQIESSTIWFASISLGVPFIVSEHAPFPWPGTAISSLEHDAIENADAFLAISNDKIRQVLLQNIKLKKIEYVGNLVNEDHFQLNNEKHTKKTFLIVAANSFYKNYDMFIAVMERLTELASKDFTVKIVGYASNKGYSLDAEVFEEKINKSKFSDFVQLIKEVPHSEMHKVYAEADAFVMTSIQEGQPVSAMEAACCGLPVFSTKCGGVEDYIDDEIGRLFNINDIEGFARSLNDFLEEKIQFNSEKIRKKIVSKFGREAFTNNINKIFKDVIDNYV